jgi:hypothetical protein
VRRFFVALFAIAVVSACNTANTSQPPVSPSARLAPTGLASAAPGTPFDLGADTLLFTDDLQARTGWDIFSAPTGQVEYGNGTLKMNFDIVGSIWSDREIGDRWNVVRVEGTVRLENADGAAGLMCGSGPQDHIGGVVNTDGQWFVVETVANNTHEVAHGELQTSNALGVYHLGVECAGTASGTLRLQMTVDGVPVAPFERSTGPADFDRGVAFASIGSTDFTAEFDDIEVYGGSNPPRSAGL